MCLSIFVFGMVGGLGGCKHRPPEIAMEFDMDWGDGAMGSNDDTAPPAQQQELEPPPPPPSIDPPPVQTSSEAEKVDKPVEKPPEQSPKRRPPVVTVNTNITTKTISQTTSQTQNNRPPIDVGILTNRSTGNTVTQSASVGNPNEDARARELIAQTFYNAWIRPSTADRGRNPVLMEIEIDEFGNVKGRKMITSSGSATMDASVKNAADAVRRIEGLSRDVARRNKKIPIRFDLDP